MCTQQWLYLHIHPAFSLCVTPVTNTTFVFSATAQPAHPRERVQHLHAQPGTQTASLEPTGSVFSLNQDRAQLKPELYVFSPTSGSAEQTCAVPPALPQQPRGDGSLKQITCLPFPGECTDVPMVQSTPQPPTPQMSALLTPIENSHSPSTAPTLAPSYLSSALAIFMFWRVWSRFKQQKKNLSKVAANSQPKQTSWV